MNSPVVSLWSGTIVWDVTPSIAVSGVSGWIGSQFFFYPRLPSSIQRVCRIGLPDSFGNSAMQLETNIIAVPNTFSSTPRKRCHPLWRPLHFIPAVGVEIKRKGFTEEQNDVKNHRRSEYPTEFRHHFRIAPDEDEDENTTE